MRLLVTGGTGLLGRALVRLAQHEVVATYHGTPVAGGLPLDVRDRAAVEELVRQVRPDAIIHTAYRQDDWATTADGAAYVAAAARGARLVFVSSDIVFSGGHSPYSEDAAPDPTTAYGAAKAAAETAVRAFDPDAVIARTSLIVGDSGQSPQERFVHRLAAGEPGALFNDNIRCPVHSGDLAAALLELLESGYSGVAHVGGPEAISRADLGRLIAERDGLDWSRVPVTPGPAPSDIRLNSTRTQSNLTTSLRGPHEFLTP